MMQNAEHLMLHLHFWFQGTKSHSSIHVFIGQEQLGILRDEQMASQRFWYPVSLG